MEANNFVQGPYATLHPFTYMSGFSSMTEQDFHAYNTYLTRGEGVWVYDNNDNRYFYATTAVPSVGLGNRYVIHRMMEQYHTLHFASTCGQTHPLIERLSQKLLALCGSSFGQVFYSNDGSGAIETAMRLARQYFLSIGEKKRIKFISLEGSYHGTTFGSGSVTHMGIAESFGPGMPGCYAVPAPVGYRPPISGTPEQVAKFCLDMLEETIFENGPDEIAAILIEPIQGVNGVVEISPDYIRQVRELADRYGILLIMDEVATGIGRTGSWTLSRQLGVEPDLLAVSKGLTGGYFPMGATLISEGVAAGLFNNGGVFLHGSTQSGHPVGCAAALAVLSFLEDNQLVEQVENKGEYIIDRLEQGLSDHAHVGDIRGRGLMIAIEFVSDRSSKEGVDYGFGQNLSAALRCQGVLGNWFNSTLILYPPLTAEREELDFMIDGIIRAVKGGGSRPAAAGS
ncbi:aminotransferase family protein [Paenibacillus tarimensis]|uniref:aminotransferase family protein n=1 Tax=Paenibacillus tarimensis TaxID=416012 RepID=UPI001F2E56A9|nr:aminotransferase class III-fold pyridoxal phosphate-dependent enzyme [Paenibacillus tarimensis]MCF2945629.1 aminotransferase class III-fold pyridoxal phosphate-dependent enzyme [Paenibacillus tarimensis]